jgi:molybdopterin converting factor small subunit
MRISYFGRLRGRPGDGREVAAESGETVARLRQRLAASWPDAADDLLSLSVRACVDDRIVGEDFVVGDAGEVAFFPPLSGG